MFAILRSLLFVALLSGLAAGSIAWGLQAFVTTPLILAAETYEDSAAANFPSTAPAEGAHDHDVAAWAPEDGWPRTLSTLGADLVIGIGFAALLVAAYALLGEPKTWLGAFAWGLAGFIGLALAPSFGLPPELPGTESADLVARQIWWAATAIATLGGLYLLARHRRPVFIILAVALILLPHLIGAPQPEIAHSAAPEDLQQRFHIAALATNFVFWLALGGIAFFVYRRFEIGRA